MAAEDLYQAAILEHDAEPRNEGALEAPTHRAKLSNPLCGDRVQLDLRSEAGRVVEARFVGRGCALSRASASMLTEQIRGRSLDEAKAMTEAVEAWLAEPGRPPAALAELEPLGAVRAFPSRVRCVTLAWSALAQALDS
jgi:nitrogen fixation NifU-like protein